MQERLCVLQPGVRVCVADVRVRAECAVATSKPDRTLRQSWSRRSVPTAVVKYDGYRG